MLRELINSVSLVNTIGPITLAASSNGVSVDRSGYDSAFFVLNAGIGGITFDTNNKIDFKAEHSDDNSTWTAVTQNDVQASDGVNLVVGAGGILRTLNAAKAAADVQPTKVAYTGGKRYLRTPVTFTGTHGSGTPISNLIELGHAHLRPVA